MQQNLWRKGSIAAAMMLALVGMIVSLSISPAAVVEAQEATATPQDPIWLGFSAVRTAIEEQEGVRLEVVSRWQFWQDDWSEPNAEHPENAAGIDSCVSTTGIAQGRPIYYGFTYTMTSFNGNTYEGRISFDLQDVAVCDIKTVAATAPADDQEAVDNPNLPDPVAGAGATGSFELGGHVDGLTSTAVQAMQRSGMTWVKKQLPVSAGLGEGQKLINEAQAAGFKILLGVVGDKASFSADFEGYSNTYAEFVAALAAAGADAIEILNEPNIDREFPAELINGATYTEVLAKSFNAIKTANPNTIVISGAPAPTGFFGAAGCGATGCNDDVFMQQMAQAGAAQFMDCVGLHYNEGVMPPSAFSGDPRGEFPTYYFSSMTNRGATAFPGKPICYTELGYLSGEGMGQPIPAGFNWSPNDPVTVAEHAAYLADAAARAAQRGDVRIMIVWNVNFTRWDSDPMGGYAIIRPDGSCPACDALGAVMGG